MKSRVTSFLHRSFSPSPVRVTSSSPLKLFIFSGAGLLLSIEAGHIHQLISCDLPLLGSSK
ncbi:hypothetical protein CIPAW_16G072400 [Carya illinoinensis]|uniref:Uncharacterized protein n=1 Tax=Carya illinoinensis TaxID=32201 RepID=A0A8T1N4A1_CARIL|nr:hypothetical protein CIPAW_16G072400 [Carya illinoinensis]